MPTRSRSRRVRIFCDYSAEPVWGDYGLDDLPITRELRERMLAWARLYETKDSGVLVREWEHAAAFGTEGRVIVRELKRQLPDWTVVYLDEAALEREWMRGKTLRRIASTIFARHQRAAVGGGVEHRVLGTASRPPSSIVRSSCNTGDRDDTRSFWSARGLR